MVSVYGEEAASDIALDEGGNLVRQDVVMYTILILL
jgi:hypothetical protein